MNDGAELGPRALNRALLARHAGATPAGRRRGSVGPTVAEAGALHVAVTVHRHLTAAEHADVEQEGGRLAAVGEVRITERA